MLPLRVDPLVAAFCDLTLPKSQWTHEAHLRVGLWHLVHHPPDEALDLLRARIKAYNVASGGENTDSAGYHETITRFYVWRIGQFLASADRRRSLDDLADELIRLLGDQRAPLRHYSRQRLMSPAARREWAEPDLEPLHPLDGSGCNECAPPQ
jgi:hypothetical protein